jgi:hypothetical protein
MEGKILIAKNAARAVTNPPDDLPALPVKPPAAQPLNSPPTSNGVERLLRLVDLAGEMLEEAEADVQTAQATVKGAEQIAEEAAEQARLLAESQPPPEPQPIAADVKPPAEPIQQQQQQEPQGEPKRAKKPLLRRLLLG